MPQPPSGEIPWCNVLPARKRGEDAWYWLLKLGGMHKFRIHQEHILGQRSPLPTPCIVVYRSLLIYGCFNPDRDA